MRKLILFLLIIQPFINKLILRWNLTYDIYNELITLTVGLLLLLRIIQKKGKTNITILPSILLVIYMFSATLIMNNHINGIIQTILYSQFLIYFFYFNSYSNERRKIIALEFKDVFNMIFWIVLIFEIFEIFNYPSVRTFLNVNDFNRGINGFYLISIFGSGPSFALFLSLYIIWTFYCTYGFGVRPSQLEKTKLFIALLFCILTFSRKEVLLTILFVVLFPYPQKTWLIKYLKKIAIFTFFAFGMLYYYTTFFSHANKVALSSDYIRWKIAKSSYTISHDYWPLGTGVGTFGSQMSLLNEKIYHDYKIGPEMLGYSGKRGPIYDAFWFTFTTELGIGIFLFIILIAVIFITRPVIPGHCSNFIKRYLILFFLIIGFFSPVLVSPYGFTVFSLLGILCGKIPFNLLNYSWKFKKSIVE